MSISDIEAILKKSWFFKPLAAEGLRRIASQGEIQTYQAGEHIFQQGDFGEHLWVLAQGQVHLERSVDLGARRGSVLVDTLGKGRVLGCWSTLLGEAHILMSSATCQTDTLAVALKGEDIRRIMAADTAIGYVILERLCHLLRERIQAAYGALERI